MNEPACHLCTLIWDKLTRISDYPSNLVLYIERLEQLILKTNLKFGDKIEYYKL